MGFLEDYFINPVIYGTGYNIVNTITYGIILVFAVYGLFHLLRRWRIKMDERFFFGIFPFIVFGGVLRALQDAKVFNSYWLITPGIYVTVFLLAFFSLIISIKIDGRQTRFFRRISEPFYRIRFLRWSPIGSYIRRFRTRTEFRYYDSLFLIGAVSVLLLIPNLKIINWLGVTLVVLISLIFAGIFICLYKMGYLSLSNSLILGAHTFDASATFVSVSFFGYWEQHVLPRFLIPLTGPWIMYPLKIGVVWCVLWLIDRHTDDSDMRNFLKIVIFILGFALGLRDTLRLGMMV